MAAWVNRRIWPNAFVCPQKVHRLSKADRAIRAKINTYHPGERGKWGEGGRKGVSIKKKNAGYLLLITTH